MGNLIAGHYCGHYKIFVDPARPARSRSRSFGSTGKSVSVFLLGKMMLLHQHTLDTCTYGTENIKTLLRIATKQSTSNSNFKRERTPRYLFILCKHWHTCVQHWNSILTPRPRYYLVILAIIEIWTTINSIWWWRSLDLQPTVAHLTQPWVPCLWWVDRGRKLERKPHRILAAFNDSTKRTDYFTAPGWLPNLDVSFQLSAKISSNNFKLSQLSKFWVGMMMVKQPFFILGLEDLEKCKGNAFGAMWLFISIFSACLIFFIFESNMQPNCRYIEHAEDHPILPPGMTDYRVNSEVELSGMMESDLREISWNWWTLVLVFFPGS